VSSNGNISGQIIVVYHGTLSGYFNYFFDDIKIAPVSTRCITADAGGSGGLQVTLCAEEFPYQNQIKNYCFVVKNSKDNTYSKVQIVKNVTNNRYIFKYGTNTSPNNLVLDSTTYNKSVRYKPNNVNNIYRYGCCGMPEDRSMINSCSWDPPLPNSNHLIGYIFYRSKLGAIIDTTKPINLAQWDSLAFTTSASSSFWPMTDAYVNIVAVYTEGKSDFLKGWTKSTLGAVDVNPRSTLSEKTRNNLKIKETPTGFYITFTSLPNTSGSSCLSIYNATGTKVAEFSGIKSNQVFWKTTNLAEGRYIARWELPDTRVFSDRLVLLK
jgi:hypothetical protein